MPGGVKTDVRTYQMYINGEWVASKSDKDFSGLRSVHRRSHRPGPRRDAEDVDRAVAAAKAPSKTALGDHHRAGARPRPLPPRRKSSCQNSPALRNSNARNTGKPIVEAEYDIDDVATCFEYYGGLATKVLGHVNPVPDNALSLSLKEPVGVAGQIIPWNYPLLMAAWKLAPALAAAAPAS